MHLRDSRLQVAFVLLIMLLLGSFHSWAQDEAKIVRSIVYREIFNAEISPIAGIERLKMSKDGSRIVFNTYGGELYTINSDGTGLTKILASNGRGYIDISDDGSVIIFARDFGYEILVFDSDGGPPLHIANNLPIPGGGTTGPVTVVRVTMT